MFFIVTRMELNVHKVTGFYDCVSMFHSWTTTFFLPQLSERTTAQGCLEVKHFLRHRLFVLCYLCHFTPFGHKVTYPSPSFGVTGTPRGLSLCWYTMERTSKGDRFSK